MKIKACWEKLPWQVKFLGPVIYSISIISIMIYYSASHDEDGAPLNKIIGTFIAAFGYVVMLISRLYLGKAFTLTPDATQLITIGIYKKVRHPIYVSAVISFFGICIYVIFIPVVNVPTVIIFLFYCWGQVKRARAEEKVLIKKFKGEYLNYKNQTWF